MYPVLRSLMRTLCRHDRLRDVVSSDGIVTGRVAWRFVDDRKQSGLVIIDHKMRCELQTTVSGV